MGLFKNLFLIPYSEMIVSSLFQFAAIPSTHQSYQTFPDTGLK